jgi:uncharacterized protein (TIGR00251 family)
MRVTVRVIPRSSKNALSREDEEGVLKARLTAPPVDGAANAALVALLADKLLVPRRHISIVRGASSRQKIVEIEGMTWQDVLQRLT